MLHYWENIYEVKKLRKNVCYLKNDVLYGKWTFPTARSAFNTTYAEKINKTVLKEILEETKNYKTLLASPYCSLDKKYPDDLIFSEKIIVYGLTQNTSFTTEDSLSFKIVKTKDDLLLWGQLAAQIYSDYDADFVFNSFKMDLRKKYATYFIFYRGKVPIGISQVIRGGGYSAVYWVGILEKYRNRGYGTELTKQTLNYEILHKRHNFILAASELGLIIYKKLGFKAVETFYEYKLKKHL